MGSKKANQKFKQLVQINNLQFVSIFEPFVRKDKVESYRRFLGFDHCLSNDKYGVSGLETLMPIMFGQMINKSLLT